MVSHLRVRVSESGARGAFSSAVDTRLIGRNGEEAVLLMSEEMLSHLIFSLYLAHLGPCDNISIDSEQAEPAHSTAALIMLLQHAGARNMCCFNQAADSLTIQGFLLSLVFQQLLVVYVV